jgi:hypothetical protein
MLILMMLSLFAFLILLLRLGLCPSRHIAHW